MNKLFNKKIIFSIVIVILSITFIFIGYKKNEVKNTIENMSDPIIAYVDGIQVADFPNSCNFRADISGFVDESEIPLENKSINCDVSTNKWKITYTGFVSKLIIYFSSIDARKITFHLSSGGYFNGIQQNSNGVYEIRNIVNYTEFRNLMNQYSNYKRALKAKNNFKGWSTVENGTTVEYTNSSSTQILSDLNLYAVWESDTVAPSCSIDLTNPLTPYVSDSISGIYSQGWTTGNNSLSVGDHVYTATDYAQNTSSCGVSIKSKIDETYTDFYCICSTCATYDSKGNCTYWNNDFCTCQKIRKVCPSGYSEVSANTSLCSKTL